MNKRLHYAWLITFGCGIVMFYGLGLAFNCISVFLNPLMESIGVSNTLRSSITAFYQSGSVVSLLFASPIIQRLGARKVIFASGLLMSAGYIILAMAHSIATCYLGMLIIGLGYGSGTIVPCSILLTAWFSKKRGFAIGLATCGSGLATIFAPTLLAEIIEKYDVHSTFFIQSAVIALLSIVAFAILADEPERKGIKAYGFDFSKKEDVKVQGSITLKEAAKDRNFLFMAVAIVSVGIIISPVVTHMSPIISQSGYDAASAAKVVSAYGVAMIIGKPLYGAIIDRAGELKSNIYIYFFLLIAMIDGILISRSIVLAYGFTILFGIGGAPIITVGLPVWVSKLFGKEGMGSVFAVLKLCSSLGGALGATLPGIIIDETGSYNNLFKIYIAALLLSFGIMQYLFTKKER